MPSCPTCGAETKKAAAHCPQCDTALPARGRGAIAATYVEQPGATRPLVDLAAKKVERRSGKGKSTGGSRRQATMIEAAPDGLPGPAQSAGRLLRFRPINRPPMARLLLLDDGAKDAGEWRRIRGARHVVGRELGDTIIAHDNDISAEHAEIACRYRDGKYEWQLNDLNSTNGTFLRVARAVLQNERELLLGGWRYVFRAPEAAPPTGEPSARATHKFDMPPQSTVDYLLPRIVEMSPQGPGRHWVVSNGKTIIGSDAAQCQIAIDRDPFLNPRHAQIFCDERGRWTIEDLHSLNGVWLRVKRIAISSGAEFQLGEQRFKFKLLEVE